MFPRRDRRVSSATRRDNLAMLSTQCSEMQAMDIKEPGPVLSQDRRLREISDGFDQVLLPGYRRQQTST